MFSITNYYQSIGGVGLQTFELREGSISIAFVWDLEMKKIYMAIKMHDLIITRARLGVWLAVYW